MTIKKLLYSTIRPLGALQLARLLSWRHPRILMYHRIGSESPGAIDTDIFAKQVRTVKKHFNVITIKELLESYDAGDPIHNAVVLTFDDGYHDFYEFALPVLQEYNVPASLFVTAGFVNGDIWLWPDKIRYCINNMKRSSCTVVHNDELFRVYKKDDSSWHTIANYCLTLPDVEKNEFIRKFSEELNVKLPAFAPSEYESLTWNQVREISKAGIEIGSHSMTHPIMTKLTESALAFELNVSKRMIERELGGAITGFCYPNGQPVDFTSATKAAVADAGYSYALAAYPTAQPLFDRWAITRYAASKTDEAFEKSVFGMSFLRMSYL